MPFSKPAYLDPLGDGRTMRVVQDVTYTPPKGRRRKVWRVPAGFITDGASIPRYLWPFIGSPFTGKYLWPAVFHDHAYGTVGTKKRQADLMFHAAMLEEGVPKVQAGLMLAGLVVGGHWSFYQAQKKAKAAARERAEHERLLGV